MPVFLPLHILKAVTWISGNNLNSMLQKKKKKKKKKQHYGENKI